MSDSTDFKVPFGTGPDGKYIRPDDASKGQPYHCPACNALLTLKKGKVKRPHFAHKASANCSEETVIHKVAKQLIWQTVTDWKAGNASSPVIHRVCDVCRESVIVTLPDKVERAAMEYRLPSGRIADVALLSGDKAVAAVEIWVRHEVDEEKAATMGLPWVELAGLDVIIDPISWNPRQYQFKDKISPCKKCRETLIRFRSVCEEIAKSLNTVLPTSYYRFAPYKCFKCKRDMLIYAWPGKGLWASSGSKLLLEPIPPSVKLKRSNTTKSTYWGNVCPHCGLLQGDWHIRADPDSPLHVVHAGDEDKETADTYLRDMAAVANYYFNWLHQT